MHARSGEPAARRVAAVLGKWIGRWSALANEAALGLGTILEEETRDGVTAADVAGQARAARQEFLAGLLEDDRELARHDQPR